MDAVKHRLAIAVFYTCAAISIAFTAMVFVGRAGAEEGHFAIDAGFINPA